MNNHQFYNLLEGKVSISLLKDGPDGFVSQYNKQVNEILNLKTLVLESLNNMTALERQLIKSKNY